MVRGKNIYFQRALRREDLTERFITMSILQAAAASSTGRFPCAQAARKRTRSREPAGPIIPGLFLREPRSLRDKERIRLQLPQEARPDKYASHLRARVETAR